jgi:predicted aldo/keto reductase-like oxidoreductase
LVHEALDLGINCIDTARAYGHGERAVGRAIRGRRDQLVLATKTWADTAEEARVSLEQSLRELETDHVDVLYLHSVGSRDLEKSKGRAGALEYLLKQKELGKTRFVGISGHSRVGEFVPLIESGDIDVALLTMNFVDRYTYGFEEKVLPVARKRGLGVCCMKVFGGMQGGFAAASGPNTGPEIEAAYLQRAVRYAMGLPGVATLVIGPHTVEHLRQNAAWVRDYSPLSATETSELETVGRQWAKAWGAHFGPIA